MATEILLSSSELENLFSSVESSISIQGSDRINSFSIPINDYFSKDAKFGISVRSQSENQVELYLEDGPLCNETIVEEVRLHTKMPGGQKSYDLFCPRCGNLFFGIAPHSSCQNCDFGEPYLSWENAEFRCHENRRTIFVEADEDCMDLEIRFSHGDSYYETEISLGGDHDAV